MVLKHEKERFSKIIVIYLVKLGSNYLKPLINEIDKLIHQGRTKIKYTLVNTDNGNNPY